MKAQGRKLMHEGRKTMGSRRTFLEVTGAALLFGVHARSVSAGSSEVNVGYFNKLAVGGYDPVAYTDGAPDPGLARRSLSFSSV